MTLGLLYLFAVCLVVWNMYRTNRDNPYVPLMAGHILLFIVLSLLFAAAQVDAGEVEAHKALATTTVMVSGYACSGSGGFVEAESGKQYIVTNAHVCNCAAFKGNVFSTFEGGELVSGRIVKRSWALDLCAAEITPRAEFLTLAKRRRFLTQIYTRGYPQGRLTESRGVEVGSVSWAADFPIAEVGECPKESKELRGFNGNIEGCEIKFNSAQTSLYARPGSPGSPVVDDEGNLVGVISSVNPDATFDGGMVRYQDVKFFFG